MAFQRLGKAPPAELCAWSSAELRPLKTKPPRRRETAEKNNNKGIEPPSYHEERKASRSRQELA
jgi:hypothetical protein